MRHIQRENYIKSWSNMGKRWGNRKFNQVRERGRNSLARAIDLMQTTKILRIHAKLFHKVLGVVCHTAPARIVVWPKAPKRGAKPEQTHAILGHRRRFLDTSGEILGLKFHILEWGMKKEWLLLDNVEKTPASKKSETLEERKQKTNPKTWVVDTYRSVFYL